MSAVVTWASQTLSGANMPVILSAIASRGIGFFQDGAYRYVVMKRDRFRIEVVRRTSSSNTFSQTITALPAAYRVVTNGNCFGGPTGLYARAMTGVMNPSVITSVGDVYDNGARVLPDNGRGALFAYFGRDNASPVAYSAARTNAPGGLYEGMGGLGPAILRNPTTRGALKYGTGNVYTSGSTHSGIPRTAAAWRACVQRNNNTYASMHQEGVRQATGFCLVAASDAHGVLFSVINRTARRAGSTPSGTSSSTRAPSWLASRTARPRPAWPSIGEWSSPPRG